MQLLASILQLANRQQTAVDNVLQITDNSFQLLSTTDNFSNNGNAFYDNSFAKTAKGRRDKPTSLCIAQQR